MENYALVRKVDNYDKADWPFSSAYICEQVLKNNPTVHEIFRCVEQYRLSGKFTKALQILNKIDKKIISENEQYRYWLNKGGIHEERLEIDLALKAYYKCISFNVDSTIPYVYIANLLCIKEGYEKAIDILKSALNKTGDIDEVYYNLGTAYARLGKLNEAVVAINKCLELDDNFPNAKNILDDLINLKKIKTTS